MKTDKADFLKRAKVPAICAAVLFVVLAVYWATYLVPSYNATIAAGGTIGDGLANEGPAWYYNGLALVGFLVASLLFFNTLFLIGRTVSKRAKAAGTNPVRAFFGMWNGAASKIGGYVAHLAMSVILVGLICSSMYVTENASYLSYDEANDSAPDFTIQDYTLKYTGNSIEEDSTNVFYYVDFDVYRGDEYVGHVSPNVQLVATTQQSKSNAAVIHFADEDLFVVYRGVNNDGAFSMDVRVNPQISLVWIGFFMLMAGGAIAAFGRREPKEQQAKAAGGATAKSPAPAKA
jgi:cytochrome c-type biogenesis protein CcmF